MIIILIEKNISTFISLLTKLSNPCLRSLCFLLLENFLLASIVHVSIGHSLFLVGVTSHRHGDCPVGLCHCLGLGLHYSPSGSLQQAPCGLQDGREVHK